MRSLVVFIALATAMVSCTKVFAANVFGGDELDFTDDEFQSLMSIYEVSQQHQSRRELLSICVGPTETYYFEVMIRLAPGNDVDICNMADQVLLGNDLNLLLLDYGIGDAGADDDAIFLAGVCPQPTTQLRRQMARRSTSGFMWRGGGGCRLCFPDDNDRKLVMRELQATSGGGNYFTDIFAPDMEVKLEAAIMTDIVSNNMACLGESPVIDVELVQVSIKDLNLKCDNGKVIGTLESLNLADVALKQHNCGRCASIDFNGINPINGKNITKGNWIKNQWKKTHGLSITATGGYSPSFKARIFDTADPKCVNVDGSRDFGSPNKACSTGEGLGVGTDGRPGEAGENCDPIGNVLIIQESNEHCPDANKIGGTLTFHWKNPILLSDIGLMDVDEQKQRLRIHYADGFFETFAYEGFGDNAVQRVIVGRTNVVKMEVIFPGSGAVTEINFCPECRPLNSGHNLDHSCLSTQGKGFIKAQEVTYFQDFEARRSQKKWTNGVRNGNRQLSRFLGPYDYGTAPPHMTFKVRREAAGITIDLDFYELCGWERGDKSIIYVDGEMLELGQFRPDVDEGYRNGTTSIGVSWEMESINDLGYRWSDKIKDQAHHIRIVIPDSTGMYRDGKLRLMLKPFFKSIDACAGWDNIKVTNIHECHENQ